MNGMCHMFQAQALAFVAVIEHASGRTELTLPFVADMEHASVRIAFKTVAALAAVQDTNGSAAACLTHRGCHGDARHSTERRCEQDI